MTWGEQPTDYALEPNDTPWHPLAPWFEHKRGVLRKRRGAPPGSRRSAVLTIVRDEPLFFPLWLGYYSRFFPPEDIHVLDHDTTDGSTDGDGFVRIPISHEGVDMRWMVAMIEEHLRRLLDEYDVVAVVDVDEIVAPEPATGTLADYLAGLEEEWVNCLGYEVLHVREEPPLDPGRPLLVQRAYWFPNDAYDKPAVSSVPIRFKPGFHARADNHFNLDPDLRLIHLHRLDYELCRSRHLGWRARPWNPTDLKEGWSVHNRITDEAEFDRWFYGTSTVEEMPIRLEEIPPAWRTVV